MVYQIILGNVVYDAVSRMIDAGHRKIAIINRSPNSYLGRVRFNGYQRPMADHHLSLRDEYIFHGNLRREMGYRDAKKLLSLSERPTCVMLCNNEITIGFMEAIRESGLRIPYDIQFVGLDRIELFELAGIPMNYIERNATVLGRAATELLLSRRESPDSPKERRQLKPIVSCSWLRSPDMQS